MVASFICGSAVAADFRVLDFDAACEQIASLEQTRDSTPFEGKLPSGYQFAFRTQEMNRDALAVYACESGKFFRGGYIFEARDETDAASLYAALKKRVTGELGAPSYDFASREHRKKMTDVGGDASPRRHPRRLLERPHLRRRSLEGDRGWRVSLSYTARSHLKE